MQPQIAPGFLQFTGQAAFFPVLYQPGIIQRQPADDAADDQDEHLPASVRHDGQDGGGQQRQRAARRIRTEALGHQPDSLRHHGHGRQLQPVQHAMQHAVALEQRNVMRERGHQQGGGQGEAHPGGEPARKAGAVQPDAEAGLGRGRAGQKLAQGQ